MSPYLDPVVVNAEVVELGRGCFGAGLGDEGDLGLAAAYTARAVSDFDSRNLMLCDLMEVFLI